MKIDSVIQVGNKILKQKAMVVPHFGAKEKEIVELIKLYSEGGANDKKSFIIKIVKIIGVPKAREFLGIMKK